MRIWIEFDTDAGMWVVGDQDGEFARSTTVEGLQPYVRGLMYGPGTSALSKTDYLKLDVTNAVFGV